MKISRHCYAITGLSFVPPWTVNAGFIAGEATTLIIDTGANMQSARTIYGYATSARPKNRLIALNTERHLDHIGGNSLFHDLGIDIYGHQDIHRNESELEEAIAEMNSSIPAGLRRSQEEGRIFYSNTHITNPNKAIASELSLYLGSFSVQIVLTPGHTPTNISVYVPVDSVLFCGDCLLNAYLPNLNDGSPEDWHAWLQSLTHIEALNPATVVPGHGEVMHGAEIAEEIKKTRQILQKAIETGKSPVWSEK